MIIVSFLFLLVCFFFSFRLVFFVCCVLVFLFFFCAVSSFCRFCALLSVLVSGRPASFPASSSSVCDVSVSRGSCLSSGLYCDRHASVSFSAASSSRLSSLVVCFSWLSSFSSSFSSLLLFARPCVFFECLVPVLLLPHPFSLCLPPASSSVFVGASGLRFFFSDFLLFFRSLFLRLVSCSIFAGIAESPPPFRVSSSSIGCGFSLFSSSFC